METQKGSSEGEDIPSDFFDDFAKDEFIEGLSVVDRWDNDDNKLENSRVDSETLGGVRDLRELIARERKQEAVTKHTGRNRSPSQTNMDDYIKPGSRRDPNKTNQAIKKDKELKVKEYLAKHLESTDDLCPPGTELDDFFEDNKSIKKKEQQLEEEQPQESSAAQVVRITPRKLRREQKYSPQGRRRSPQPRYRNSPPRLHDSSGRFRSPPGRFRSPPGRFRESPGRFRESPGRFRESPGRFRDSPGRFRVSPRRFRHPPGRFHDSSGKRDDLGRHHESPIRSDRHIILNTLRRSPEFYRYVRPRHGSNHKSRSPQHLTGHKKERKYSNPKGSPPRALRRDRSPISPREQYRRSHSRSPINKRDDFLYPQATTPNYIAHNPTFIPQPEYPGPMNVDYYVEQSVRPTDASIGPLVPQVYNAPQVPAYTVYNDSYQYVNQPPQPVPAPIIPALGNSLLAPTLPSPVPTNTATSKVKATLQPSDALAKLVADGILSHEDYLKLAPNKGAIQQMDTHRRVGVITRCNSAISKLSDLLPPNRLIVGNVKKNKSLKSIGPKFCSPLKKKPIAEFNFTKISVSAVALQNKQIIDTIISTLELHDVVGRPKKNLPYNVRDVAVQTSNPQCDLCVIRKATLVNEVGTSINPEHFSTSTHTQVVEEDLQKSRSVFNPSGSSSDGAPISFAHMTPAQLVSQLVARAKTLREPDVPSSNQFQARSHYNERGGSRNYRNNYNNYRY